MIELSITEELHYAYAALNDAKNVCMKAANHVAALEARIDAHNKRCDEECQAMKFFKHPEGLECSSNDKCDLCPRRYRIEG